MTQTAGPSLSPDVLGGAPERWCSGARGRRHRALGMAPRHRRTGHSPRTSSAARVSARRLRRREPDLPRPPAARRSRAGGGGDRRGRRERQRDRPRVPHRRCERRRALVQRPGPRAPRCERPADPPRRHDAGGAGDGRDRAPHAPPAGRAAAAPRRRPRSPSSRSTRRSAASPRWPGARSRSSARACGYSTSRARTSAVTTCTGAACASTWPAPSLEAAAYPAYFRALEERPLGGGLRRAPRPAHRRARRRLPRPARHRRDARGAGPPRQAAWWASSATSTSGRRAQWLLDEKSYAASIADLAAMALDAERAGAARRRSRAQRGALPHFRESLDRGHPAGRDLAAGRARRSSGGAGRAHPPPRRRGRGERLAREAARRVVAAAPRRPYARVAGAARGRREDPHRMDPRRLPVQRVRDRPRRRRRRDAVAARVDDRRDRGRPPRRAVEHVAQHHPAQGGDAGARVPGAPRPPHRPAEPQVARRAAGRRCSRRRAGPARASR